MLFTIFKFIKEFILARKTMSVFNVVKLLHICIVFIIIKGFLLIRNIINVLKCEAFAHIYILHHHKSSIMERNSENISSMLWLLCSSVHWIQYNSNNKSTPMTKIYCHPGTIGWLQPHNVLGSWTVIPTHPMSQKVTEVLNLKIVNIFAVLQLNYFHQSWFKDMEFVYVIEEVTWCKM